MSEFGACCACGMDRGDVRNFITLEKLAPVPGTGWGCVLCGLPGNGAVAVVCDACAASNRPPRWAVHGWAADKERIAIEKLSGSFAHNAVLHRDQLQLPL